MAQPLYQMIEHQAGQAPDAAAIAAPGRRPLPYARLQRHLQDMGQILNGLGVGRNDRVAIVLPNGAEMAVAFLAVASRATSAPLNPAYGADEFDFFLADLRAKALIVQSGLDSPARAVARARAIPIVELSPELEAEAGIFTLSGDRHPAHSATGFAHPDDVALVLHTSGTTAWPKMVPLTHVNLSRSADNIRQALQLGPDDRCLNVMPLFHIHGLVGALLASLSAGASVVCSPGFEAGRFFSCMAEFSPTWYTAVPTMHQAILAQAASHRDVIEQSSLRFVRSSSASLPPQVMAQLEEIFNAPVIESYGMTEAAHQMASNPLPPARRKPGSVGLAAGPEVAILDEAGRVLLPGAQGEIVIRGANVTAGYDGNPAANRAAFVDGWFRTGDQGFLDDEGYLFITGRIKEIINRGGEKIIPREVDELLLEHPAVAQAVTFAVPHRSLGENVAAAVVLKEGATATENELREFAFAHLAYYKVPSRVLIVYEIPKGPTGKLQRIGLADKLAHRLEADYVAPRTQMEQTLAGLWADALHLERVGVYDNFFSRGGDSLQAAQLALCLQAAFQVELPPETVFRNPTIDALARLLADRLPAEQAAGTTVQKEETPSRSSLVTVQAGGAKRPLFLVPSPSGTALHFVDLARHLGPEQPVYSFHPLGLDGKFPPHTKVEDMATHFVREMRFVQPAGPYLLGGMCSGSYVAFEMAQQLQSRGEQVALLAVLDVWAPSPAVSEKPDRRPVARPRRPPAQLVAHWLRSLRPVYRLRRVGAWILGMLNRQTWQRLWDYYSSPQERRARQVLKLYRQALQRYKAQPYAGRVTLFQSEQLAGWSSLSWTELVRGGLDRYSIPKSTHVGLLRDETDVRCLAEQLRACLDKLQM